MRARGCVIGTKGSLRFRSRAQSIHNSAAGSLELSGDAEKKEEEEEEQLVAGLYGEALEWTSDHVFSAQRKRKKKETDIAALGAET